MSKVTFDGATRIITIITGVTDIDVKNDIYLEWKKWVQEYDNSKWLAAFNAFGGNPTTPNQNAPNYFFLINGWKIKVENLNIIVHDNLYSDDNTIPYININSTILSKNSDIPGVDNIGNSLTGITNSLSGMSDLLIDINLSIDNLSLDVKRILGLSQENFRIMNHVYVGDNLSTATVKIYNNSADCTNDVSPLSTYSMIALYDAGGKLIDYKVTKN